MANGEGRIPSGPYSNGIGVLDALYDFEHTLPEGHTTVLAALLGDNGQFSVWSERLEPQVTLAVIAALRTVADEMESKLMRETKGSA